MSLEQTLERIAVALEKIAERVPGVPVQTSIPLTAAAPAAPKPDKKPVEVEIPTLIPQTAAPAAAPVAECPIKDGKSLMDYVMASYKAMGTTKGAEIQKVLQSIGCQAINEVRPDQYAALYAGIEALKAA